MAKTKIKVSKNYIPKVLSDEGVNFLIEAVVKKALTDYEDALENQKTAYGTVKAEATKKVKDLEKFFRSTWGNFLTNDCGELIIKIIRKKVGVAYDVG